MPSGSVQQGFTYVALLILVAALGTGLAAYGELASHAAQREKETQLLWIGEQFRQAIGLYYQRTPGATKRYPRALDDLLVDSRFLTRQRYLRRIYDDPLTGKPEWGLVVVPEGGIAGVYSLAQGRPVHSVKESQASSYQDWRFVYEPPANQPLQQLIGR
ncbi:MAG: type II secretion system protein [Gemmatimonadaceae bacterium]